MRCGKQAKETLLNVMQKNFFTENETEKKQTTEKMHFSEEALVAVVASGANVIIWTSKQQ